MTRIRTTLVRSLRIGLIVVLVEALLLPGVSSADTTALSVTVVADDARENAQGALDTEGYLLVRSYAGETPWQRTSTGLRFQDVDIPHGSVITASYITIYTTSLTKNDANLKIYVEDTGDAEDFVTNPHIIDQAYRPRTVASSSWVQDDVAVYSYVQSPSLNAPLQELVSGADWVVGNSLAILMIANEDVLKGLKFGNLDGDPDQAVSLTIEYTPPPRWYLHDDDTMYRGDHTKPAGTELMSDGGTNLWLSDEAATTGLTFPAGAWNGRMTLAETLASGEQLIVSVGSWNGSTFTPAGGGPQTLAGDGISTSFPLNLAADSFTVGAGDFLALHLDNPSGGATGAFNVVTGQDSSYLEAPSAEPNYPVPELPTIVLLGAGLAGLLGCLVLRGRADSRRRAHP